MYNYEIRKNWVLINTVNEEELCELMYEETGTFKEFDNLINKIDTHNFIRINENYTSESKRIWL